MSADEQPIRSLSGTVSVWSHSADSISGASTPAMTSFSTSTLSRPSAATGANGSHSVTHSYSHRHIQSQGDQNLGLSQNPGMMIVAGAPHAGAYLDKGNQTTSPRFQDVRKLGSAAIPIVRPSPSSQTTVGHIGDGRKRGVLGNLNVSGVPAPTEVEQTAVLLRSLDITPPLTGPSVNSCTTTPISRDSSLEPLRLRIDPYGQYSSATDYPYRSLFDPFFDSADTPVTQSPITPDRHDTFDLPTGFQGLTPFDIVQGGVLSRQNPYQGSTRVFPLHASNSQESNPSLYNPKFVHPQLAAFNPNATLYDPHDALAIRAAPVFQAILQGHYASHGSLNSSATNPDGGLASKTYEANFASTVSTKPATEFGTSSILPETKGEDQIFAPGEPFGYQRSPSPYWRFLPVTGSQSLPQLPPGLDLGPNMKLFTDAVSTSGSKKPDGWVTSFAPSHDAAQASENHMLNHSNPVGYTTGSTLSGNIAPWSVQQPLAVDHSSRLFSIDASRDYFKAGFSSTGAPRQAQPSFASQSPSHVPLALPHQGGGAFDPTTLSSTFLGSANGAQVWPPANDRNGAIASFSKAPPSIGITDSHNHSALSTLAPPFVSSINSGGDSRTHQSVPPTSAIPTAPAHATFAQPRLGNSRSEEDETINFLQLLQPNANPPYNILVNRIVRKSDQQASIFIQQKLKNASSEERSRIVSAIVERGLDMMQGRFGNWCVQRCLEDPCTRDNRMIIVECMAGHIVELSTNCYGTHVVQKALECEEDIKRIIVNELLENDPAFTLTSKHCSHVWAKVMELSWHEGPAPPIFRVVNQSLRGKWASLACHETGSLVVQTMFENMDEAEDKRIIVDEILENVDEVVKNQWGAFVIQHIIEHGNVSVSHRTSLSLINNMAIYGTHDIAVKSLLKILKEKNPLIQDAAVTKMCEPNIHSNRNKRPVIVDLALSSNGSQLIQAILPGANKDQRARLYEAVKGHTVTLRGCKTGSRVIWLFDRMRAYYGY